jgi:hypothetical protein
MLKDSLDYYKLAQSTDPNLLYCFLFCYEHCSKIYGIPNIISICSYGYLGNLLSL